MTKSKTPEDVLWDDPPSSNEDVAKLRLQLINFSLEELEEEELVNWDRDKNVVTKGPQFNEKRPESRID